MTTSDPDLNSPLLRNEKVMGFPGVYADEADHNDENRQTRLDASTVVQDGEVIWVRLGVDNEWGHANVYLRPDEAREYLTRALAMLDE